MFFFKYYSSIIFRFIYVHLFVKNICLFIIYSNLKCSNKNIELNELFFFKFINI